MNYPILIVGMTLSGILFILAGFVLYSYEITTFLRERRERKVPRRAPLFKGALKSPATLPEKTKRIRKKRHVRV